jgi:general secretion pathway protein D
MRTGNIAAFVLGSSVMFTACSVPQMHREAIEAVESGNYEVGIELLESASHQDPDNMAVRLDLKAERERAIQTLIAQADAERANKQFDAAEATYTRVLTIEARNGRALRGLESIQRDRRHEDMVVRAQGLLDAGDFDGSKGLIRQVLAENPGHATAQNMLSRIDAAQGPIDVTPRLRTANDMPVTLQFRDANTAQVFEVLSRQTGINFIFDRDVPQNSTTTIFVQRVPIEQAIDLILSQNQLSRQIMSENMIMIYPNTPAKQSEYQNQLVRTFYLTNTDPAQFSEVLQTMLNVRTVYVDDRARAVVIRDTPEIIRMAESLLASLDVAEAEVMMEVEVLEVTRTRLQQLGIGYPSSYTINPTPLAGDPLVLADLGGQDRTTLTVTPVPITVDLRKEVGVSNLLASPRIRARNREQASILIGQRVPVITNSVTPTSSGAAVVTGNVQYVDVGLTLDVEPTIYQDGEVAIDVNLEVSNIIREIFNSTSGTLAYQIGTRNASTVLRLKDGETQVLAGLIQDIDRDSSSRIPGLGDIPILGRLFGTKKDDTEETEIILSITPRIIRAQPRPASESIEFFFGTEANVRSGSQTTALTRVSAPATQTAQRSPSTVSSSAPAAANRNSAPGSRDGAPPPPARLSLAWQGPGQVAVGQEFDLTLDLDSPTELDALRAQIRYDSASLELISARSGDMLPGAVEPTIEPRAARVQLNIDDLGNAAVSGAGNIMVLRFRALAVRPATQVSVQQFAATDAEGLAVPVMAPRPFVAVISP